MFKFLLPAMIGMLTIPLLPALVATTVVDSRSVTQTTATTAKSRAPSVADEENSASAKETQPKPQAARARKVAARAVPATRSSVKSAAVDDNSESPDAMTDEATEDPALAGNEDRQNTERPDDAADAADAADADNTDNADEPDTSPRARASKTASNDSNDSTPRPSDGNSEPPSDEEAIENSRPAVDSTLCIPHWASQLELKPAQWNKLLQVSQRYDLLLRHLQEEQFALENEREQAWAATLTRDQRRDVQKWLGETLD